MGWSCTAKVSKVLEAWTRACLADSDLQNVWHEGGAEFFWESDNVEYPSGCASGSVWKIEGNRAQVVCQYQIAGSGKVLRAPKFLVDAAKEVRHGR